MLAELSLLARYTVTADEAVYAIPFRVYRAEDVAVTYSTNGRTETALTLGKDYSVQILPEGGAELSLAAGVAGSVVPAGAVLAIASAVPATQEADFSNTATVNTGALETQLDREVQMIQQLKDGLARAVMLPAASNESPEELLEDIFAARDTAVDSATGAAANANAAANSAQAAAGSCAIATEEREAACICAGEAKDARDVAIAQTEAANTLMEAELAKVNAIVAANRTDQQAAVTAARQWAEKEADAPVDYDEDGNPRYSARHWAENAQKIAIEPPTAEKRGAIRVGAGLRLETGENGESDVLTVAADHLGGGLRINDEALITESCVWTAPCTGWYDIRLTNGGDGAWTTSATPGSTVWPGSGKGTRRVLRYYEAGSEIAVTIGAGGLARSDGVTADGSGGVTVFDGVEGTICSIKGSHFVPIAAVDARAIGGGYGGGDQFGGDASWYGAGGGGQNKKDKPIAVANGYQGCVRLYFHNPAKASGPAPQPALLSGRRMAVRAAAAPVTVNLYDPETGQGSVWREEDAEAKLAEGLITEAEWLAIRAARAAEERADWLADPETLAGRFEMLRAARDAKLAATDYLVAPDYPLTDEQRAAVIAYRQALRDLPAQAGAPWDGGGGLTPWPEAPAIAKVQA